MNSEGQIKISVFVILFSDYPPHPAAGLFFRKQIFLERQFYDSIWIWISSAIGESLYVCPTCRNVLVCTSNMQKCPKVMKLRTILPYIERLQNVYQSRVLPSKFFLWHQHFHKLIDFNSHFITSSGLPFRDFYSLL